jgi:hypothetical protein
MKKAQNDRDFPLLIMEQTISRWEERCKET